MAEIKIRFKQAYYDGELYYEKGETYTLDASHPIPSRDVEILEGESTYQREAAPKPTPSITKMKKDVAAATRRIQEENIAAKE